MKVNFALLLDPSIASATEQYSAQLAELQGSRVILGSKCLPHVSVVQTECSEAEVGEVWSKAASTIETGHTVSFAGLTFVPDSSGNNTWIEIQVLKSSALLDLQQALLASEVLKGRKIYNGIGDAFRPHVTVALTEGIPAVHSLPTSLLRLSSVTAKLSLGLVGDNFVYLDILRQ